MFIVGRGVFATKDIEPGQFVAQYCGQLLSQEEGDKREMLFPSSFRYFFNHRGQKYWYVVCLHVEL